jgi:hypothetical protein
MLEVSVSALLSKLNSSGVLSCDVNLCCDLLFCDESDLMLKCGNEINKCEMLKARNLLNKDVSKKRGRPRKNECSKSEKSEPKKRGRPRKEKCVVSTENASDDLIASLVRNAQEVEEEEEVINVKRQEVDGKMYLISSTNIVFDINTEDEIGIYDKAENKIVLCD